jgi:phosphate transport system substrate-binding protein
MRTAKFIGIAMLSAVALSACGTGAGEADGLEGSVRISGSSTVEPISLAVSEHFNSYNRNWAFSVGGPGTTAGFEQFCNGDTDISNASRGIKGQEIDNCSDGGITPIELKIGIDGLAVIVSQSNDSIGCLNFEDLYAIFGAESNGVRTWEDAAVFAAELGSATTDWPSGGLAITAPGDESGTWGSFIEITLEDIQEGRAEAGFEAASGEPNTRRPGDIYVASPNDNVIIDGVGGNPNGIGFVGFAFAVNNQERVRMIEIAGDDGICTAPTAQTVAANDYAISRDLYIYVDQNSIGPDDERFNGAVAPFVDFYLTTEGQQHVSAVGYVQLSDRSRAETQATWSVAKGAAGVQPSVEPGPGPTESSASPIAPTSGHSGSRALA